MLANVFRQGAQEQVWRLGWTVSCMWWRQWTVRANNWAIIFGNVDPSKCKTFEKRSAAPLCCWSKPNLHAIVASYPTLAARLARASPQYLVYRAQRQRTQVVDATFGDVSNVTMLYSSSRSSSTASNKISPIPCVHPSPSCPSR